MAVRYAVLPEIIIALCSISYKAEINKACSVSSHSYLLAIATSNRFKITGENDCLQVATGSYAFQK